MSERILAEDEQDHDAPRSGRSDPSDSSAAPEPADRQSGGSAPAPRPPSDGETGNDEDDSEQTGRRTGRFGRPGRPLRRNSPFYIGFVGGLGILIVWYLSRAVLRLADDLVLSAVALLLAVGLDAFVQVLTRRGIGRAWAVTIVTLSSIIILLGFVAIIVQPLAHQTTQLIHSLPTNLRHLEHNRTIEHLDAKYHILSQVQKEIASQKTATALAGSLLGLGQFLVNSVYKGFTVAVLTLYFLGSLPALKRTAYQFVPASRRNRAELLGDEVFARIAGYAAGALLVATCAGLSSWLVLGVIGVRYALPLALLIGITDLIPLIGATLGAVLVTAVVLIDSPIQALICAIFFIGYQQLENYFIYPRVMAKTVKVPAAAAVIAALLGTALLGAIGALIAVPLTSGAILLVREVFMPSQDRN